MSLQYLYMYVKLGSVENVIKIVNFLLKHWSLNCYESYLPYACVYLKFEQEVLIKVLNNV